MKLNIKFKAFSLLEVSLNLLILGITLCATLPVFYYIQNQYNKKNNFQKQEYIRISLQSYLLKNGFLPFAGNEEGNEVENLFSGYIPYKALGISKNYIKNSDNKYFVYNVNQRLTKQKDKEMLLVQNYLYHKINKNSYSFARNFNYNDVLYYDLDSSHDTLIITDNDSNIMENDFFYAYMPISKKLSTMSEVIKYVNNEKQEKYKVYNCIAYVINLKKNEEKIINIKQENNLYYQTKFDMLAQIGFPCTSESNIV